MILELSHNTYDFLLAIATMLFMLAFLPQVFRHFQVKDSRSHSYLREMFSSIGLCLTIFVVYQWEYHITVITSSMSLFFRFVLIFQIHRYRQKPKEYSRDDVLKELWDNSEDDRWDNI